MEKLETFYTNQGSDDSELSGSEETIETQLLDAVENRDVDKVCRLCLETEVDVALRVRCARLAIESNSKAENADKDTVEILRLLLEENLGKKRFNEKDGFSLRSVAVHEKEIDCLKYLVERLALDVNLKDKNGFTPLFDAVKTGWAEGVEYLLEEKADMTIVCGVEASANEIGNPGTFPGNLECRAKRKKKKILGSNTTKKKDEPRDDTKTVLQLAVGLKPSKDSGRTADDLLKIFNSLVETARRKDDRDKILNDCNLDKKTPLFIAVLRENLQYVKILLEAGADMTLLDKDERSVLHWASEHRAPKIMEALLKHRAREIKRIRGETKEKMKKAQTEAKSKSEREANAATEIEANAEVHLQKLECLPRKKCKGKFVGNPLLLAVYCGDVQNTVLLMNEGSDSIFDVANVKSHEGCNVLHLASLSKNAEVINYICRSIGDKTPPKCARKNLYGDLRRLVRNKTKYHEYTPLHLAIMAQQVDFVYALIAAGSDLSAECYNVTTQSRNTAMYMLIYQMPPSLMMMSGILDRAIKKDKRNVSVVIDFTVLMAASQTQVVCECSSNSLSEEDAENTMQNEYQSSTPPVDNLSTAGPSSSNEGDVGNFPQSESHSETAFNGDPRNTERSHAVDIDDEAGDRNPLLDACPPANRNRARIQVGPKLCDESPSLLSKQQENKFAVLNALQETGNLLEQRQHLQHPLVESFLYLHWKRLQGTYAILVFLHVAFALLITLTIVFNLVHENFALARVLGFIALVIMTMLYFQSVQSLNAQDACQLYLAESLMKLAGFYLATKVVRHSCSSHLVQAFYDVALFGMMVLYIMLLVYTQRKKAQLVWGSWQNFLTAMLVGCFLLAVNFLLPYSPHDISAFAILLLWFEVLLHVSRIPHYGYYMLMFIEVAFSYLKLLLSFLFIIVGFTLVFMLIFRVHPPFDASLPALMKTIVMMNNEFEYDSLSGTILSNNRTVASESSVAGAPIVNLNISEICDLNSTNDKPSTHLNLSSFSQITAMVFFIIFIVSVGLVMTNIFVGVAVNDIQKLQIISKQIEFLGSYDQFLLGKPFVGSRGLVSAMFKGLCNILGRLGMKDTVKRWKSYKTLSRVYCLDDSKLQKQPQQPAKNESPLENDSVSGCSIGNTQESETKFLPKMKFPKKLKSAIIAKGYANREQLEQNIAIKERKVKDEERVKAKQKAKAQEMADMAKMSKDIVRLSEQTLEDREEDRIQTAKMFAELREQLFSLSALTSELLLINMRQDNHEIVSSF